MKMLDYYIDQLRGADNWPQTDATISSCEWIQNDNSRSPGPSGWYAVTFSYRVENEYYEGDFTVAGASDSSKPYQRKDKLIVGYIPTNPLAAIRKE
jgi:hypothetical protein